MSNDYEVGYGKPPKHTRFKEGRSGNPKGRPKGRRNFKTDLMETLESPIQVRQNGRPKTVSTQLATLMRLREKALGGDPRALDRYINLAQTHNDEDLAEAAPAPLTPTNQEILDSYFERRLRCDRKQPTADQSDPQERNEKADDDDAWLD